MAKTKSGILTTLAAAVASVYIFDRSVKMAALLAFFARPQPPAPATWASVSLIQPITQGAHDLDNVLACRAALRYPGTVQHILVCDHADAANRRLCATWQSAHPQLDITIVLAGDSRAAPATTNQADRAAPALATKIAKLQRALAMAQGDVVCFVDDDVALRPEALTTLVTYLQPPQTGAVFGLACYTNWRNAPSSLLSGFVNANALLSYIPLTFLTEPYTITGHLFALRRRDFAASGGLNGLQEAGRIDDDHELARRVRRAGLRCVQTPVIYDVHNNLATFSDYANQMRRWFIIPRQTMIPQLTPYEQVVSLLGSAGNLLLPLLTLLTFVTRTRQALLYLSTCVALFAAIYAGSERRWLRRATPLHRWPWVLVAAFVAPLQALAALAGGDAFTWRGVRYRLHKGGRMERIG